MIDAVSMEISWTENMCFGLAANFGLILAFISGYLYLKSSSFARKNNSICQGTRAKRARKGICKVKLMKITCRSFEKDALGEPWNNRLKNPKCKQQICSKLKTETAALTRCDSLSFSGWITNLFQAIKTDIWYVYDETVTPVQTLLGKHLWPVNGKWRDEIKRKRDELI